MSGSSPTYRLTALAWLNVCLHAAALTLAASGMRTGTPLVPLAQRLDYLATAPLGWALGWACWMACAFLLIAFLAAASRRLGDDGYLARLGLVVAVVGAAFDLIGDSVYIVVLPMIASWRPTPEPLFLTVERLTGVASLVVANGAYSVAIVLVSAALSSQGGFSPLTVGIGYAVGASGLLLAAAGFTGVPWHVEWAAPPTIGLFCVWVVLVARSFEAGGRPR